MKLKPIVVLKIMVSLGLLALVFTRVDLSQAWIQFQALSLPFVAFALLYYTGLQWLSCLRWQVVLWSTNHSAPMGSLLSSYFAGMFLNIFLPGALGGDVYRVYRVAQKTKDSEAALVSVFLERFTGLAALSALAVLGLPPAFKVVGRWDIILLFFTCVGALVGGVLLIVSPRLLIWAEPLLQKLRLSSLAARFAKIQLLLRQFAQHPQALALSMGLSFLLQLGIVYYHYLVAQQLKIPISYLELLVFIPIIVVVTLLPISLGGLGVKEGLWVYLFSRIGLTAEQALLLSLTITLLSWLLSLPGGVILLLDSAGFQQIRKGKTSD
ncbi:MAG: lysylphosphatidylglycerol synthase transmembrane domain-containing protein [Xenococcaceae cyanobacterium]